MKAFIDSQDEVSLNLQKYTVKAEFNTVNTQICMFYLKPFVCLATLTMRKNSIMLENTFYTILFCTFLMDQTAL